MSIAKKHETLKSCDLHFMRLPVCCTALQYFYVFYYRSEYIQFCIFGCELGNHMLHKSNLAYLNTYCIEIHNSWC